MDETIKFFVGLDAHKDSIAIAVCDAGREPSRFVAVSVSTSGRTHRQLPLQSRA